jgi:hypothetical protein
MNLSSFYNKVLEFGIDRDIRGKGKKIKYFPDTAILHGSGSTEIKKIIVGIDMEAPELLIADRIRQSEGLDLVIAHHPEGAAYAALHEVMQLQVDMLVKAGFPKSAADAYLAQRMREVQRRVMPQNHMRSVDAARILNLPFMCMHTPADNHVFCFVRELMRKEKPKKVKDALEVLRQVPEYKEAESYGAGPRLILGSPQRELGRIFVEMTGGTEGHRDVYNRLYKCGVRTLISMHLSEEHFKKVNDANINVIIAGHISSDTLGLNLLFDRIERAAKEKFQFINCSGFRRIRR